jgi:hypothetical protein
MTLIKWGHSLLDNQTVAGHPNSYSGVTTLFRGQSLRSVSDSGTARAGLNARALRRSVATVAGEPNPGVQRTRSARR